MITVDIDGLNRIEHLAEEMCDGFCYFATISRSQDVSEKHCEDCPMSRLLEELRIEGGGS